MLPTAQPRACMPSPSLGCKPGARYQAPALHSQNRHIARAQCACQYAVGVVSGDLHNSSVALRSLPLAQRPDPRHNLARPLGLGALV